MSTTALIMSVALAGPPEHRADLNCDVRVDAIDGEIITQLINGAGPGIGQYLPTDECGATSCHPVLRADLDPQNLSCVCMCCNDQITRVRTNTVRDYGRWQREASKAWRVIPADE